MAIFTNSVDPYEMPRSQVYDLGLHCLPITLFGFIRTKSAKNINVLYDITISGLLHREKRVPIKKTYLLLYSKTRVYRGIHYFLISAQKHRLWVLVRTASTSTHNLCFERKCEKYQIFFYLKIFIFSVIFSLFE